MKKKLLMLTLTGVMVLSTATAVACGGKKNPEPDHKCTWETAWSADDTHHWYACEDKTCTLVKDKAEHEFADGKCSVCEQVDPDYAKGVEVIGFNAKESISVLSNTKIVLEKPAPIDQYGEKLTVYMDVTTKDGKHVTVISEEDNKVFYAKEGEYVISYVVYPKDKVMTLKTTSVIVVGEDTVSAELDSVVEIGKEVLIVGESGFYNPTFTYSVKKANGDVVAVNNGIFTPDTIGYYDVTVKATSGEFSAEETYKVLQGNQARKVKLKLSLRAGKTLEKQTAMARTVGRLLIQNRLALKTI